MIEILDVGPGPEHEPPRRRWRLVAAGLAVALAAIAGGVVLLHQDSQRKADEEARLAAPDATFVQQLTHLGLTGPAGGSLAGDQAFRAAIQARVAALSERGSAPQRLAGGARNVRVLWAGDQGDKRVVVVGYEPANVYPADLTLAILFGAAGDRPDAMEFSGDTVDVDHDTASLPITLQTGLPLTPAADPAASLLFVVAPAAQGVTVAHDLRFMPNGTLETVWRPLAQDGGGLWAGSLSAPESSLGRVQVDGADTILPTQNSPAIFTLLHDRLTQAAEPGTDPGRLLLIRDQLMNLQPSAQELAVFADSVSLSQSGSLTAGVLRSPENGYLVGWSLKLPRSRWTDAHREYTAASLATRPVSSFGQLLAAVQFDHSDRGWKAPFAVIAPAGAVRVRSGAVTAPVVDRLALLYLDAPDVAPDTSTGSPSPVKIEALDRRGQVMAQTQAAEPLSITSG